MSPPCYTSPYENGAGARPRLPACTLPSGGNGLSLPLMLFLRYFISALARLEGLSQARQLLAHLRSSGYLGTQAAGACPSSKGPGRRRGDTEAPPRSPRTGGTPTQTRPRSGGERGDFFFLKPKMNMSWPARWAAANLSPVASPDLARGTASSALASKSKQ